MTQPAEDALAQGDARLLETEVAHVGGLLDFESRLPRALGGIDKETE